MRKVFNVNLNNEIITFCVFIYYKYIYIYIYIYICSDYKIYFMTILIIGNVFCEGYKKKIFKIIFEFFFSM